ncbi:hypothetical protein EVAR_7480_1 [Eumeta japonica]|uniref:Uncharacterized protein n=1 Tax=Eumeta variegata TaxID=151549 RepID=A0A4C1Y5F8_EUMVA|nr:hypothetical protein EVAR_7480_1 [Eumeta japonica]
MRKHLRHQGRHTNERAGGGGEHSGAARRRPRPQRLDKNLNVLITPMLKCTLPHYFYFRSRVSDRKLSKPTELGQGRQLPLALAR